MKSSHRLPRRDRLHLLAKRADKLTPLQIVAAWDNLTQRLHLLSEADVPKFDDLLHALRLSIISARHVGVYPGGDTYLKPAPTVPL